MYVCINSTKPIPITNIQHVWLPTTGVAEIIYQEKPEKMYEKLHYSRNLF